MIQFKAVAKNLASKAKKPVGLILKFHSTLPRK